MGTATSSLSDFEKTPLLTLEPGTRVMDAQELARRHGVHHLPIVSRGQAVGMVCTCDLLVCPSDSPVSELMKEPVVLSIDSPLRDAAELMASRQVGSVLLTRRAAPVGIVTRGDLFEKAKVLTLMVGLRICERCGARAHLRNADRGHVLCVYCQHKAPTFRLVSSSRVRTYAPRWSDDAADA